MRTLFKISTCGISGKKTHPINIFLDKTSYTTGDVMTASVQFSSPLVVVTGIPYLSVNINGTDRPARYVGGSGSDTLTFTYTVQSDDAATAGQVTFTSPLTLSGRLRGHDLTARTDDNIVVDHTFTDSQISHTVADVAVTGGGGGGGGGTHPTITSVTLFDGSTYAIGDTIIMLFNFSDNMFVAGGVPSAALTIGTNVRQLTYGYPVGSFSSTLLFHYVVTSDDTALAGTVSLASPVILNGGTLKDIDGNDSILTFTPPDLSSVIVNVVVPGPTILDISRLAGLDYRTGSTGPDYWAGSVVNYLVTFSDTVIVLGTPEIDFNIGTNDRHLVYASGSGTDVLVFDYLAVSGDSALAGHVGMASPISLNGGTIQGTSHNDAVLAFTAPDTSLMTFNTASSNYTHNITKVAFDKSSYFWSDSDNNNYSPTINVTFDHEVSWTGTPYLMFHTDIIPIQLATVPWFVTSPATTVQFQIFFEVPNNQNVLGDHFTVGGLHWGNSATQANGLEDYTDAIKVLFTAIAFGSVGNNITLTIGAVMQVDDGTDTGYSAVPSQPLLISVTGTDITILAATDSGGNLTTTKSELIAGFNAVDAATALVTMVVTAPDDSTIIPLSHGYPASPANLASGFDTFDGNGITAERGDPAPVFTYTVGGGSVSLAFGSPLPDISNISVTENIQATWNVTEISYAAHTHGIMTLLFPEPVFVVGVPKVNISITSDVFSHATYASGSGTNTLTFDFYGADDQVTTGFPGWGLPYANAALQIEGTNGNGPFDMQINAGNTYGGALGNAIQYRWLAGANNQSFSLDATTVPLFVDVKLQTDSGGAVITTYQNLLDAIENDNNASNYLSAWFNTGDGSGPVIPTVGPDPINLTGGADNTSVWVPFTTDDAVHDGFGRDFAPLKIYLISPNTIPEVVA